MSRVIDKTKRSNVKCEHCKYWRNVNMGKVDRCTNPDSPKYDTITNYWNRCKCFDWKKEKKEDKHDR